MGQKSGGGGSNTTVQSSEPWAAVQPHLKNLYNEAGKLYNQAGPNLYPGGWTAPRNPLTNEAENRALGYSESPRIANMQSGAESALTGELLSNPWANPVYGNMRSMMPVGNMAIGSSLMNTRAPIASANPAIEQMLSGDPFQNSYTKQLVDANAADMTDNFNKHVMPSMRSNITAYNPGGSSRGEIAQGLAYEGLQGDIADKTTQMYQRDYEQALQRQMAAAAMAEQGRSSRAGESLAQAQGIWTPALAGENSITQRLGTGAGLYPSLMGAPLNMMKIAQDVGLARREEGQRAIDELRARYEYDQNLPYQKLAQYAGIINPGMGAGGTSTTTQTAQGGSGGGFGGALSGAIGGAGAGAGLASMFGLGTGGAALGAGMMGPTMPFMATPAAPLILGAGLLGGLGGLF